MKARSGRLYRFPKRFPSSLATVLCLLWSLPSAATETGTVERISVRGSSLEGNLSGDSPIRDVAVYLPASYAAQPDQRYPVVYMLHGFTDSVLKWLSKEHWITLPDVLERGFAREDTRDLIVVMPDAFTRFHGSFYSSSVVTGNWERFISEELVAYIDAHYRTIPERDSRGLAGHSMGGYGTMRIGMKHPDVFSALYLLNPCCMEPRELPTGAPAEPPAWEEIETIEDFEKAEFLSKAVVALSPGPRTLTSRHFIWICQRKTASGNPLFYQDSQPTHP